MAGIGMAAWAMTLGWRWAIGGEGVGQGLLDRRSVHAEGVGDLAAVDDEGLGELVLHLEQFAHGGLVSAASRSRTGGT